MTQVRLESLSNEVLSYVGGKRKNYIINGNFDIWQRRTSVPAGTTGFNYLADRWKVYSLGSTYSSSQQEFIFGQTDVPGNPRFYQSVVVSSVVGTTNSSFLTTYLENVASLSGKTVTLSFYAKADSAKYVAVEAIQNFGTGGTPSADVNGISSKKFLLSSTWQKITHTFTFPSVAGKKIGTSGYYTTSSQIRIYFDAGTAYDSRSDTLGHQSGIFDIAQVQLEEGTVATDFERIDFNYELMLCKRYYEKSYEWWSLPGTVTTVGTINLKVSSNGSSLSGSHINFKVEKRNTPTITFYSDSGVINNWKYLRSGVGVTSVSAIPYNVGTSGFNVQLNVGAAWVACEIYGHYVADADF
jgi:hypothetical protein